MPKFANFAEQIANFRFGRKSGEVSVASIVRKQGDKSKRNFTARDEISHRQFVPQCRTKFRFGETKFRLGEAKFRLSKIRS